MEVGGDGGGVEKRGGGGEGDCGRLRRGKKILYSFLNFRTYICKYKASI